MNRDLLDELTLLRELGFTHLDLGEVQAAEMAAAPPTRPQTRSSLAASRPQPLRDAVESLQPAAPPPSRWSPEPASAAKSDFRGAPGPNVGLRADAQAPPTEEITSTVDLESLSAIAAGCLRCRLCRTRTQVVFGIGSPTARLMFVGEAPGRDEDERGEPFVGRAGQLLTDIIKAMKLSRDEVYITNVIKCRPPDNRNPEPDELDACRPYIRRQIAMIKPHVIVTLGRFALQSLTGQSHSISSSRGQWLDHEGIRVMPTYHPAYLLRTPSAKKDVWSDMKQVMAELEIEF